jgi:branched-subunit amino acid permease
MHLLMTFQSVRIPLYNGGLLSLYCLGNHSPLSWCKFAVCCLHNEIGLQTIFRTYFHCYVRHDYIKIVSLFI